MRRILMVGGLVAGILLVASPAQAFAHNDVANPYLHAGLDVLTLAVISAPLWTAYFWGPRRRGWLLGLVAVVQLPVAVIGFAPLSNPVLHTALLASALALTGGSLWVVRRAARVDAPRAGVAVPS
jgi:hypothetical protein